MSSACMGEGSLLCRAIAVGLTFIAEPTAMPFFFPFVPALLLPLSYKHSYISSCIILVCLKLLWKPCTQDPEYGRDSSNPHHVKPSQQGICSTMPSSVCRPWKATCAWEAATGDLTHLFFARRLSRLSDCCCNALLSHGAEHRKARIQCDVFLGHENFPVVQLLCWYCTYTTELAMTRPSDIRMMVMSGCTEAKVTLHLQKYRTMCEVQRS